MAGAFWDTLPTPFFVLAPLADVTDAAFRRIIAACGKPHVFWTEFTSAETLCALGDASRHRSMLYSEAERPIVAQLYGADPTTMEHAAALVAAHGFDGIDINMGCPERSIVRRGAGAALCQTPRLAQDLIRAAQRGAGARPVSVKIRIGYSHNEIETWLPAVLAAEPAAVTIHARTRRDMSKVPARWEVIAQAVAIRHTLGSKTYIIGNGDVGDLNEARCKSASTGVDGVMLGRAIFGNPWLFDEHHTPETISVGEKLRVLVQHTQLFATLLGESKPLDVMKKHYRAYVTGFTGAEQLRAQLMGTRSVKEVEALVTSYLAGYS
jgi:nifR3 family TIM-barrel protein